MAGNLRESEEARCLGPTRNKRIAGALAIDREVAPYALVEASRILENDRVNIVSGICEVN